MASLLIFLLFLPSTWASRMVPIPGGAFKMGSDEESSYRPEKPAHLMRVKDFWLDVTEVTNQEFVEFIQATSYVTVAERKPKWEDLKEQLPPGTARIDDKLLVPGSSVFIPPKTLKNLDDASAWWKWTPGASWKNPEGPGSSVDSRLLYPVVHVAYEDAMKFCHWKGKRLPTEAEWEYASRGGLEGKRFAWGDEFRPQGKFMANTFQGKFPQDDTKEDGYKGLAPVGKFPANPFGIYDMIGNAWEWVGDWYSDEIYSQRVETQKNLEIPKCHDSEDPYAKKRVIKGGSYLCSEEYCTNYRPSARRGTAYDTGMSHISFRCASDKEVTKK